MIKLDRPYLRRLPTVKLADGSLPHVDESGLVVGRFNGILRVDNPGDPPATVDILAALDWVERRLVKVKTPNISSYKLKHACEKLRRHYTCNGAMVIALYRAGYSLHCDWQQSSPLNVRVGVSMRHYNRLPETSAQWESIRRRMDAMQAQEVER